MTSPPVSASELPLEAAAGQCLMVGFPGTEPPEDLLGWIAQGHVGGIILFTQNVGEPTQVRRLCEQLQEAAAEGPGAVPLMIAVDQEGGWDTVLPSRTLALRRSLKGRLKQTSNGRLPRAIALSKK